ncbi:unnamed protein product [marine sediment metagenome]|uniref:Uncharacterized protein n=1 Tax=marine sediment metagenome TaxID=412755 RepID=X1B7T6_9ZZZZ
MKRIDPCETCANRPGCEMSFNAKGCHYYPAWGSPAFDRIRDQAREAAKDQRRK